MFEKLDEFFIELNKSVDIIKLKELKYFVARLRYPFTKKERKKCHKLAKLALKNDFCGFRMHCKLSKNNKRIQCSLKLDKFAMVVEVICLDSKKLQCGINNLLKIG